MLYITEQALATWRQTAEAVKKEVYVVYDNAKVYGDDTLHTASVRARPGLHDVDGHT
jgi:hypothetical protein